MVLYKCIWNAFGWTCWPLIFMWFAKRDGLRLTLNRFGMRQLENGENRTEGKKLIWLHGASLGESVCSLSLRQLLLETPKFKECGDFEFLITCFTTDALNWLERKKKEEEEKNNNGFSVSLMPLDFVSSVSWFLDHWKPCGVVLLESDLWPNVLDGCSRREIPVTVVNARMSTKSFKRWLSFQFLENVFRGMTRNIKIFLAQSEDDLQRIARLTDVDVKFVGNIKCVLPILQPSPPISLVSFFGDKWKDRASIWLAASTHEGEEEVVWKAHQRLMEKWKGEDVPLLVIAPRHPKRVDEIEKMLGFSPPRRSRNDPLQPSSPVFIVDSLGEMSALYATIPVAVVGGSLFNKWGGHNTIEAVMQGSVVFTGPYTESNEELIRQMNKRLSNCIRRVVDCEDIVAKIMPCLENIEETKKFGARCKEAAISLAKETSGEIAGAVLDTLFHKTNRV